MMQKDLIHWSSRLSEANRKISSPRPLETVEQESAALQLYFDVCDLVRDADRLDIAGLWQEHADQLAAIVADKETRKPQIEAAIKDAEAAVSAASAANKYGTDPARVLAQQNAEARLEAARLELRQVGSIEAAQDAARRAEGEARGVAMHLRNLRQHEAPATPRRAREIEHLTGGIIE